MIAVYTSTIIEVALILLLGWGAAHTLRMSYVFNDVVRGFGYLYPLSPTHVYLLIILLVGLLGVFLVFAFNTKGLKWYIIPIVVLCVPSAISLSELPRYLYDRFGILLEYNILLSNMTLEPMLVIVLLLVAGFLVLYQMVSLREMSSHLMWRGVDDADVSAAYKGRSISVTVIVLVAIAASYLVSYYTRVIKDRFESLLDLSPLLYLAIGIAIGFVAVAIIITLLVIQKPKKVATAPQPKKFGHKVAGEAKAVLHIFVPSALTNPVGKFMVWASRPLVKSGRSGVRRIKSSRRYQSLKRFIGRHEE